MNIEQALVNNCSSDQSKLYQYINSITRSRTIPLVMHYDSVSASSSFDKACLFNDFFFSIFTNESSSIINLDSIPVLSQSLSNISFSDGDVYEALINLKQWELTTLALIYLKVVHLYYTNRYTIYLP